MYQRTGSREKVSAVATLCIPPSRNDVRLYFRLHPNTNICAHHLITFLRDLLRQLDAPIVLVWDRLLTHRSVLMGKFVHKQDNLTVFLLPPYAPELNPVEQVWCYLKTNPLANLPLTTAEELATTSRKYSRSIQHSRSLLRSFVRHSPLSLRLR